MIGALRAALTRAGVAGNTLVVFSSDNGYHMGQYRLNPGKMTAFDTDVRVPLVVAGPGIAAGTSSTAAVENIDLAPTRGQLAGSTTPSNVDGHRQPAELRGDPHGDVTPTSSSSTARGSTTTARPIRTS